MKIAIVLNDVSRSAGTERAGINLANLLAEYGKKDNFDVLLISVFTSGGESYYKQHPSVRLVHLGMIEPAITRGYPIHYIKLVTKLRGIVSRQGLDWIVGTAHALNMLMPLVAAAGRVRTVGCEHLYYGVITGSSRLYRSILYGFLDKIVVLTQADAGHYRRFKNVEVIPNSIPFAISAPAEPDKKQILAIGRLTAQKGFDLLLSAAELFLEHLPGWMLKIVGDGEMRSTLADKISGMAMGDRVELAYPTSLIREEYLASSIYVMSSRFEGLPMVLLEAQACGLPCVSFNCPEGPAEIINDGVDGYLVENGNISELSAKIVLLARDKNRREMMGRRSLANAEKFSPEKIFLKWQMLFNQIIQ